MNVQKANYQKQLEQIIAQIPEGTRPKLLLHSCCAPCSSYCMEYLREYFDITVFFYNPNISSDAEYEKRVAEEKRLIAAYNEQVEQYAKGTYAGEMTVTEKTGKIRILEGVYEPERFYEIAKGLEALPEGGERCFRCFELRFRKTFECALAEGGFDYVATTLTISPLKNAEKINEIGAGLGETFQIAWLPTDFKKKNGYKRSIELSHLFDLYRQNFCGCAFSARDAAARES